MQLAAIAARAGLRASHVLYYFGSRDEVLIAAVAHAEEQLAAGRRERLRAVADPSERLAAFVDAYLPDDRHDPVWKLWIEGWMRSPRAPSSRAVGREADQGWLGRPRRVPGARHGARRHAAGAAGVVRPAVHLVPRRARGPRARRPHHARPTPRRTRWPRCGRSWGERRRGFGRRRRRGCGAIAVTAWAGYGGNGVWPGPVRPAGLCDELVRGQTPYIKSAKRPGRGCGRVDTHMRVNSSVPTGRPGAATPPPYPAHAVTA